MFSAVAQLPSLRSLHLTTSLNQETWSPEALRPYATCVACLSALTALTRLQLNPSFGYYDRGDSRRSMGRDPNRDDLMREVWAAHHTSLLSALRCMPQLQSLTASALWLRPSELAPLTSLTSITVPGLLPDLERPSVTAQGSAAGGATLLPPHLQELLLGGASPRALAELRPQQALSRLCAHRMRFGVSDVDTAGRLRAEAVAAVGPAVRLLTTYRDPTCKLVVVHIANDARHSPLLPPEGVPNGHMEWIRQLQGLDGAFRMVTLEGLALGPGDLSCLGESLRDLERERPSCNSRPAHRHGNAMLHAQGHAYLVPSFLPVRGNVHSAPSAAVLLRSCCLVCRPCCPVLTVAVLLLRFCLQAWHCGTAPSRWSPCPCFGSPCCGWNGWSWTCGPARASATRCWRRCCCPCAARTAVRCRCSSSRA